MKKKIKLIQVPIFTEEFSINVAIGTPEELEQVIEKYLGKGWEGLNDCRGKAYNPMSKNNGEKDPLIVVDGTLPAHIGLATLAHEASHAVGFIEDFISVEDSNGEFHAHGIASIMRAVGKRFLKRK